MNYNGSVSIDNTIIPRDIFKPQEIENEDEEKTYTSTEIARQVVIIEQRLLAEQEKKIAEIEESKAKILELAQAQADEIIKHASIQGQQLREQEQTNGYNDGYNQGKFKAEKEAKTSIDAIEQIIAELNRQKESIYIKNENELIDLAYEMTKKITLSEIKTDKDIIFTIVKQACKSFRNSQYIKISLAQCDVEKTIVFDEEILRKIAGNIPEVEIELLSDANSGTILIDNDSEIIDASVNTQLDFLKEVFNGGKMPSN